MANAIEQTVLLIYGKMAHNGGIKMTNAIEQTVLLLYQQMEHESGISMAKISQKPLKNGSKTERLVGHGPMKKQRWSSY